MEEKVFEQKKEIKEIAENRSKAKELEEKIKKDLIEELNKYRVSEFLKFVKEELELENHFVLKNIIEKCNVALNNLYKTYDKNNEKMHNSLEELDDALTELNIFSDSFISNVITNILYNIVASIFRNISSKYNIVDYDILTLDNNVIVAFFIRNEEKEIRVKYDFINDKIILSTS